MALRPVSIDCLTANYRILGDVYIGNSGVAGSLSGRDISYLEIHNARIARITTYQMLKPASGIAYVMKNEIHAACLEKREDIGPGSIRFGKVSSLPVRVTTGTYEAEGNLEWSGRFEYAMLMADAAADFFTLFDASLYGVLVTSLLLQSPIILLNRKQLATFVTFKEEA